MIKRKGPSSIKVGTAGEMRFAKFLLSRSMEIPESIVRFMAGPPTTEQERFHRKVAEARIRTDWPRFRI